MSSTRKPDAPAWLPADAAFHHIGYASPAIERDAAMFELLGYAPEGAAVEDPVQGVRIVFMTGPGPRIELLQNLPGRDTLTPWLDRGLRMYHLAWRVADLDAALAAALRAGGRATAEPAPAVAFGGCRIVFVMLRQGLLVELIEKEPT
jgi:methylmalonyl-CoA/ethylmalonyl-CoA epimerase